MNVRERSGSEVVRSSTKPSAEAVLPTPTAPWPALGIPKDDPVAVLDVRIRYSPALPVVRVAGELDLSTVHLLADALDSVAAAAGPAALVVLDLTEVTFCDVAGLRAMERGGAVLAAAGRELMLYQPPAALGRLITMTGIGSALTRR